MNEKRKLIKYFTIGLVFFISIWIINFISDRRQANYSFSGKITSIVYNEKKIPTVRINNNSYGLLTPWSFNEKMKIGDSLIKRKGSMSYTLIKCTTGEIIIFDR